MFRSIFPPLSLLVLATLPNWSVLASMSAGPAFATAPVTPYYDSARSAVIAAVNVHNPASIREDREYIGAILQSDGRYTWVAAAGIPGRDRVRVRLAVPADAEVVAFWHTHGAAAHSHRYFSATDTDLVRQWRLPFYLADHTGTLKVFRPGDRTLSALRARRLGLPRRSGFAAGTTVLDRCGEPLLIATVLPRDRDHPAILTAKATPVAGLR